jgi:hypothetical protein
MYYDNEKERHVVHEAHDYQKKTIAEFIATLPVPADHSIDNTKIYMHNDEMFTINTFNYIKMGLQGEYKDFYELITSDRKSHFLSANRDKLRGFCGWINRITT